MSTCTALPVEDLDAEDGDLDADLARLMVLDSFIVAGGDLPRLLVSSLLVVAIDTNP